MASSPTPASRLLRVVLLVAVLGTAGCGGGGGSAEPASTPSARSSDVDGAVSIGDGRSVYAKHRIGDIPMTVITNDSRGRGENHGQQTNVRGQRGWLVLSPRARQVILTFGHDVPNREPDLVLTEILKVLDAARVG